VSSATDVAKGAASVVLTEPGLTNIIALVEPGRTLYQRILTWSLTRLVGLFDGHRLTVLPQWVTGADWRLRFQS